MQLGIDSFAAATPSADPGSSALLVGNPGEMAAKILRHSEALGGVARVTFQMDNADLAPDKLLHAIELLGTRVAPLLAG